MSCLLDGEAYGPPTLETKESNPPKDADDDPIVTHVLCDYLRDMQRLRPGALILGCTHYPLLKDDIGRYEINVEFTVINPRDSVAIKELVNQVIDSTFRTQ